LPRLPGNPGIGIGVGSGAEGMRQLACALPVRCGSGRRQEGDCRAV